MLALRENSIDGLLRLMATASSFLPCQGFQT